MSKNNIGFLHNKIYLDGGATQPMPSRVLNSLIINGGNNVINPNNDYDSDYYNKIEDAVERIAEFIGRGSDKLVFGKSTTELINNVASQIDTLLQDGHDIVISDEEHNANYLPWKEYLRRYKMDNKLVILNTDDIPEYCANNKVGILSIAHTTNVLGETRDLKKIGESLNPETLFIVDGCQHAPHCKELDIPDRVDMYVFSGHKIYAPKGIAVAYMIPMLSNMLEPFLYGGGNTDVMYGYDKLSTSHGYLSGYGRHHAGTQCWNDVMALAEALNYNSELDHERPFDLATVLKSLMRNLDITIYNKDVESTSVVFKFNNVLNYDAMVDDGGFVSNSVYLRDGTMCNLLTMDKLGADGVLRITFSPYNTMDDVNEVVRVIRDIEKKGHR